MVREITKETPDIETSSDDYASRFDGPAGDFFLKTQSEALQSVLSGCPLDTVIDVGGGHGQLVPDFLERGAGLFVLGSHNCTHRRIRDRYPDANVEFVTGNVLNLPFEDSSIDVVVSVRLISHIEAWEVLIAEFCRVARHSVIFDYPSWFSLNALTPLLFTMKKGLEGNTRTYRSFFRWQLSKELQKHGFEPAKSRNEFLIPMFLHRALRGAKVLRALEKLFKITGLTSLLGSPVILRADRVARD